MSDFEHQRPRPNAAYSPVGRAPFLATERFIRNTRNPTAKVRTAVIQKTAKSVPFDLPQSHQLPEPLRGLGHLAAEYHTLLLDGGGAGWG